jgi:hypothetical protein
MLAQMEKAAGARGVGKKVEYPEGTPISGHPKEPIFTMAETRRHSD